MDNDGAKTIIGTIGLFASVGWGAIAHLYTIIFSLPTMKRLEEMEARINRRLDDQQADFKKMASKIEEERVRSAGYFGRLDIRRRPPPEDDDENG